MIPTTCITPDDVRGDYETLGQAIIENGWPTLAESRGKVMFALDNTGRHKTDYLSGSPNLEDRVMFVSSEPGEPTAGFIKMNDVTEVGEQIKTYTADGFLVRTRSDVPTSEARSGDTTAGISRLKVVPSSSVQTTLKRARLDRDILWTFREQKVWRGAIR